MTIHRLCVMALAIVLSGAAEAQEMPWPAPNCAAMDLGLPVSLAGWQAKNSLTSATQAAALDTTTLPLGQGMIVTLHPTGSVVYVTQPEKPGGSVAHGGMVAVFISKPGRYQVSLGSGAWIDMVRDGAFVTSVAHAPGPKCSSIRKTVIFPLQPGRYVLQISANADPTLPVMVTPMP